MGSIVCWLGWCWLMIGLGIGLVVGRVGDVYGFFGMMSGMWKGFVLLFW